MSSRLVFAVVFVLCLPTLLPAQGNRRGGQPAAQPLQQTEVKGTIQAMGSGGIMVTDDSKKTWRVTGSNATKFHVTGTMAANQLKPGMLAEITAEFDDHGLIKTPVDALTITSISQKPAGVFPAGGGAAAPTGGDAPGKRPGAKAGIRTVSGTFRIVGRINIGRNGALSIQAGPAKAPFTLATEAKITVDTTDSPSFLSLVTRGSAVTLNGMTSPQRPGYIQATEVTVELSPTPAADAAGATAKKAAE